MRSSGRSGAEGASYTKISKKLMEHSEFTPFQNFTTFDMKNTNSTPTSTAALFSEADHVALETFLAGLIEQAEKAAENSVDLHDQMTSAEWAELDAALDHWLEARAIADRNTNNKAA